MTASRPDDSATTPVFSGAARSADGTGASAFPSTGRPSGDTAGRSGAAAPPSRLPLSGTERTRLRRHADRAVTDRAALYEILDAGLVCHFGLIIDGSPRVLPTAYGRDGDTLYLHGSTGAVSLHADEICVTVTHLDGLVLARSVFNHSMNYRSAVIYGRPRLVTDPEEKLAGLRAIVEHLTPGRWAAARHPTRKELAATAVIALPLDEASVKTRQGPPADDEADHALDVWAGVLPVRQVVGDPVPDPRLRPGIEYSVT